MASVNIKFTTGNGTTLELNNVDVVKFDKVEGGTVTFHQTNLTEDATLETSSQLLKGIIGYGKDDARIVGTLDADPTGDATMTSGDLMLSGITAYAKGTKYTGTIPTKTDTDITSEGGVVTIPLENIWLIMWSVLWKLLKKGGIK